MKRLSISPATPPPTMANGMETSSRARPANGAKLRPSTPKVPLITLPISSLGGSAAVAVIQSPRTEGNHAGAGLSTRRDTGLIRRRPWGTQRPGGGYMSDNLYELLCGRFPADPQAPCFILRDGTSIGYGALADGAARAAALMARRGVKPGDRVVLKAEKSPQSVMAYLATLMAGAVYVPLNTAYTAAETDYFLADAEPALVLTDPAGFLAEAAGVEPLAAPVPRAADDLASIIYTSGTTGRSKGAMLSHANLASNALALHAAWGFSSDDVLLHALPIFHVHGLFVAMHCAFLSGAPMVWLDKFDDAVVIEALPRATVMMGVPTCYTQIGRAWG